MKRAAISVAVGVLAGAVLVVAYLYAPHLGVSLPPQLFSVVGSALALSCTVAFVMFAATAKPPAKPTLGKLAHARLSEIENLIVPFPDKDEGKDLFIRPETYAKDLDPVNNPDKYRDRKLVLKLRGTRGDRDPFNPVKLRDIFSGLAYGDNLQHVLLFDEDRDFAAYIPAWYARSAFVASDAETRIARAITDIYKGSVNQIDLRAIRGAGEDDVVSSQATLGAIMPKLKGGISMIVVMGGRKGREPIGYISSESVLTALAKTGVFNAD